MIKKLVFFVLFLVFVLAGKSQTSQPAFDTTQFNKYIGLANYLIDYEFYMQLAIDKYSRSADISNIDWICYPKSNTWYISAGTSNGNIFTITKNIRFDSLNQITETPFAANDSLVLHFGAALARANEQFQLIRDTCNLYFNSFVLPNPDQSISIWFLPAFQPSGQAIYGCEWEYVFDKNGQNLIRQYAFTSRLTGVWIGQPRELWLNYRNADKPTPGSVYFAEAFRDYFTKIRIDTRNSTSTLAKNANGHYTWSHKMK